MADDATPPADVAPTPATSRSCSRCGSSQPCDPGGLPEGWSVAIEDRRRTFQCVACVRANITWIEGGISSEWWDR